MTRSALRAGSQSISSWPMTTGRPIYPLLCAVRPGCRQLARSQRVTGPAAVRRVHDHVTDGVPDQPNLAEDAHPLRLMAGVKQDGPDMVGLDVCLELRDVSR